MTTPTSATWVSGTGATRVTDLPARAQQQVVGLVDLALHGLRAAVLPGATLARTVRAVREPTGVRVRPEGTSERYTAITALGLARVPLDEQRATLGGLSAAELALRVAARVRRHRDPGAIALGTWASAEVAGRAETGLLTELDSRLTSGRPLPTVDVAWMLTAAVATLDLPDAEPAALATARSVRDAARARLLDAQGPGGLFPHALPARSLGRWRAHVGCFADQVYPVQALARLAATGDGQALAAADRAANRIVALQGAAGQWWWHYDARGAEVVEQYPVYSVHQHAMAPMALLELQEAGGADHRDAVVHGLRWLDTHPEVLEDLVSTRRSLVWRKVGRREPRKAARSLAAVTTSLSAGRHLPGVDRLLPPTEVDHECRPYELGWLLYAWPSAGLATTRSTEPEDAA